MGKHRKAARASAMGALSAAVIAGVAFNAAPPAQAEHVAAPAAQADQAAADSQGIRFVDIKGEDGTVLKANVVTPSDADGKRRYPLIVLPTSWATPQVQYLAEAHKLADAGYVVLSYNTRGFWQSGGYIEVAGPPDIADVSKVIDWGLANTPADPDRIGMAGMSHGAGISLMASAFDKRIKAVVSMSGWADLAGAIYSERTPHVQAVGLLGGLGYLTGHPSPEFQRVLKGFMTADMGQEEEMLAWAKKRSPATYLDRINANGAAVMLGNAWGDTIFPPNQYANFYEKLTGPKRLEFQPGDHATSEGLGLFGLPNDVWGDAHRWFNHYLKGENNGIDREPPVQLKPRTSGDYEGYADWKSVPAETRRIPLEGSQQIDANTDSGADGGTVILSSVLDQFFKLPPMAEIPTLPHKYAAVWQSERYADEQRVRGTVKLHTTLTSTHESGTAVAYLYDVGPLGIGKLITNAPFTFHGRTPGQPFGVDLELFSTAYDVPAGHRLAVVVDTVDPLYIEQNPDDAKLTFSSPAEDPSYVDIPLNEH